MFPEPRRVFERTSFLRDLDDGALDALSSELQLQHHDGGETIFHQGSRPLGMFFLVQGTVEIYRKGAQDVSHLHFTLEAGDTFGELELLFPQPRLWSARAKGSVTVYLWPRAHMAKFLKSHPDCLRNLRFLAQSRRLADQLRFPWLGDGEVVYGLTRKHPALLIQALVLPFFIFSAAAALIVWGLLATTELVLWVGAGMTLSGMLLTIWRVLDWRNDYYILTNRRVVWLEKVIGLYDSRVEAPLSMVLSVSVSTDVVGRSFGYGDVLIRTYTGKVVFRNVGTPQAMAALVEEHWQRMQARRDHTDREGLRAVVRQKLEGESAPQPEAAPVGQAAQHAVEDTTTVSTSRRLNFKVRFEDGDVITYRKHWAVLIREIAPPSVLFLLVAGLIGARVVGWITPLDLGTFALLAGLSLIPLGLWWLYRYVDWANDIYQVSPEQIVDIYKKPLGREVRKVAPLENILGTEVDRKGLVGILLNYGDVIANVGTAQFTFEGIYDPVSVQQDLIHAQETFIQRQKETARRARRDEMVELLDIYHDEYAQRSSRRAGRNPENDGPA